MQLPHLRWHIAIILCLVTTINYVDRQALSVTAPLLMENFSISNTEYGWITSGFLFAYALGQFLSGPLIDRFGSKRAFSLAVVLWSLAGMLHAAARGVGGFFVCRIFLGFTEAANFPAALKAIAEWFPEQDRSIAVGILMVGPGLGAIIAPPLIGLIIVTLGWQWAFIIPGAFGFIWLALWLWYYDLPEQHRWIQAEERQLILKNRIQESGPATVNWAALIRQRHMQGLLLSRFLGDGPFYFFVFWLPAYLASTRGFDITQIAMTAWFPFLAADLGSLAGGWLSARLMRAGISLNLARKTVIWAGALLVSASMPVVMADSAYTAIGLIALAMFAIQVKAAVLFALPADIYPPGQVATAWGLFGAAGSLGAMLFSPMVGWMVDNWSYTPVFILVPLLQILAAWSINLFIPRIGPVKD